MGRRRSEINHLQIPRFMNYTFIEAEIDFLSTM